MAASQKTLPTGESVEAFIAGMPDGVRRDDARKLCGLLAAWTGEPPAMWGSSIVGFGQYRYRFESGHELGGARGLLASQGEPRRVSRGRCAGPLSGTAATTRP